MISPLFLSHINKHISNYNSDNTICRATCLTTVHTWRSLILVTVLGCGCWHFPFWDEKAKAFAMMAVFFSSNKWKIIVDPQILRQFCSKSHGAVWQCAIPSPLPTIRSHPPNSQPMCICVCISFLFSSISLARESLARVSVYLVENQFLGFTNKFYLFSF